MRSRKHQWEDIVRTIIDYRQHTGEANPPVLSAYDLDVPVRLSSEISMPA
jgi:hypothetical protein